MWQPTYLATIIHVKEILPDRAGGLNCPSSSLTNLLMAQIKTISLPDQRTALEQLLTNVKYKIRSLRKSEKSRERHWLVKKAKNDFKSNP